MLWCVLVCPFHHLLYSEFKIISNAFSNDMYTEKCFAVQAFYREQIFSLTRNMDPKFKQTISVSQIITPPTKYYKLFPKVNVLDTLFENVTK